MKKSVPMIVALALGACTAELIDPPFAPLADPEKPWAEVDYTIPQNGSIAGFELESFLLIQVFEKSGLPLGQRDAILQVIDGNTGLILDEGILDVNGFWAPKLQYNPDVLYIITSPMNELNLWEEVELQGILAEGNRQPYLFMRIKILE